MLFSSVCFRRKKTCCVNDYRFRTNARPAHGDQPMFLHGDPAYLLGVHLQGHFRFGVLADKMKAYNIAMGAVRSFVEWLFADIVNYIKFLDFKKNLKLGVSSISKIYIVSALFQNALTCFYGNNTSTFFDLDPSTLEEYLSRKKVENIEF